MSEFNSLENKIIRMEEKLDNVAGSFKEYQADNKEDHKQIRDLINKIDEKKADRVVVEEIRGDIRKVVWIVVGGVLAALMAVVIKQ